LGAGLSFRALIRKGEQLSQQSVLRQIIDIRREEWPQALLMAVYFFLVITSFWILKPLKKSLFIEFYDQNGFDFLGWQMTAAQAELLAKAGNMLVALVAATVFAVLARWLRRQQLTYIFAAFSILCCLLFGFLLRDPHGPTVWGFYLYGDLFNTLMVPTFFAFLNDSVTPRQAKRLYGLIILGGVLGGGRRFHFREDTPGSVQPQPVDVDLPAHRRWDYRHCFPGGTKLWVQTGTGSWTSGSDEQPKPVY